MNNINSTSTNSKHVAFDFFNTPMNVELAEMYFSNFKNYEEIFSNRTLEIVLNNYELREFATSEYIPVERAGYYENKGYYELTKMAVSWTFKEYKGGWERDVKKPARQFVVPNSYQLSEKDFLRDCLLMEFPYLKNYAFDCYKFEHDAGEFYVKTGEKGKGVSLYVPFKALKEKNPQIIIDRMNSYWKWYYSSPDKKKYLDKQLGALESETAKKFFEDIVSSTETNDSDYSRCNNCMRIFSEDRLELLVDEGKKEGGECKTWYEFAQRKPAAGSKYEFFRGCPFCKTDAFLTEIE